MPMRGVVRYEAVTVSNTSIGMTATVGTPAYIPQAALITVENAAVRFRVDGTAPTATEGHMLEAGDTVELVDKEQVSNFRAIRRDGADATLRVTQGVDYIP